MAHFEGLTCALRTDYYELHLSPSGDEALCLHGSDLPQAAWDSMAALVAGLGFRSTGTQDWLYVPRSGPEGGLWGLLDYEVYTAATDEVEALEALLEDPAGQQLACTKTFDDGRPSMSADWMTWSDGTPMPCGCPSDCTCQPAHPRRMAGFAPYCGCMQHEEDGTPVRWTP